MRLPALPHANSTKTKIEKRYELRIYRNEMCLALWQPLFLLITPRQASPRSFGIAPCRTLAKDQGYLSCVNVPIKVEFTTERWTVRITERLRFGGLA